MEYRDLLQKIYSAVTALPNEGKVADYIPELATVDPDKFGIFLFGLDGKSCEAGDCREKFSIQSIVKVLSLTLAFERKGEQIWNRVDVEPSGTPFNSLVQLEYEKGIPRNPLINAGALVICDILISELINPEEDFLAFVRDLAGSNNIHYNPKMAASEKKHGYRNCALINLMKSFGNIHNETERVLDFYFNICSLEMSCQELAGTFSLFANRGVNVFSGQRIISSSKSKRISAIMQTCGFYDEAGEFTFRVGLPGKSGVGGGIAAIFPGHYSVAVWSPPLNEKGNSEKGMKALELLTTLSESSMF